MANFLTDISEESRLKITLVASILSLICIIPSLMLLGAGAYIQVAVQTKARLIKDLDATVLPSCIITIGFMCVFHNSFCGAVVFLSRRKKKREGVIKYLFPTVIVGLVLCLAIFAAGIMCFVQITHLSDSLRKGISTAMKEYKSNPVLKQEIDIVQIEFECCGNDKYTDWFAVSWIHSDYLSAKSAVVNYINDDVPFSCCNPASPRPCINHDIHDNKLHHNYDFRLSTTLHNTGCRPALDKFYGWGLLTDVGALIVCISLLQGVAVILTRIIQTSMATAYENGDLFGPATGYIFWCKPSADDEGKDLAERLLSDNENLTWGSDFQDDDNPYDEPQNEGDMSLDVQSNDSSEHIYHSIVFSPSSPRKSHTTADNSFAHLARTLSTEVPSSHAPPVPSRGERYVSPPRSRSPSPVRVPSSPSTPLNFLDVSPQHTSKKTSRHSHSRLIPSLKHPVISTM
ncbi:peripherin-2-like [Haliotis cracherodii]|uniref:peripherin-2-like n=1 Tax=Haliotis cracherodii TaxID=6455 RepID=UPI0039ED068D